MARRAARLLLCAAAWGCTGVAACSGGNTDAANAGRCADRACAGWKGVVLRPAPCARALRRYTMGAASAARPAPVPPGLCAASAGSQPGCSGTDLGHLRCSTTQACSMFTRTIRTTFWPSEWRAGGHLGCTGAPLHSPAVLEERSQRPPAARTPNTCGAPLSHSNPPAGAAVRWRWRSCCSACRR